MSLAQFRRPVVQASLSETVASAARKMAEAHVGCLVVLREGEPFGVVTDRDLALRVVAAERDPKGTRIEDVVTFDPVTVCDTDGIETAITRMRSHGVRRLPVVDREGHVVGIVTADDVLTLLGHELGGLCEAFEEGADASDSR
jgi:CBS domain-containing protein